MPPPPESGSGIDSLDALKQAVEEIRQKGEAVIISPDGQAYFLAAPVIGPDGQAWLSLGLSVPVSRCGSARRRKLLAALKETCARVGRELESAAKLETGA